MELEIQELITILGMKMKDKRNILAEQERELAMQKSDFNNKFVELEKLIRELQGKE